MRKALLVARHEFRTNLRRPGFVFTTLFVPLLGLILLAIGAVAGGRLGAFLEQQFTTEPKRMAYVDYSGLFSPTLPQYAALFTEYANEAEALRSLLEQQVQAAIVIPADYLQHGTVTAYSLRQGLANSVSSDSTALRSFLVDHLVAGKLDPAVIARLKEPYELAPVLLDRDGQPSNQGTTAVILGFIVPYAMAMLLIITIFTSSGFLLQGVSAEKDSRVIEILISSLSSTELMAGKILGLGALGLLQVLVWTASGWGLLIAAASVFALSGTVWVNTQQIGLSVVYFLLGHLLFGTLMAAAGALGTSAREGQQIGGFFAMGAALPMMVMSLILSNPNSTFSVILSCMPFSAPVTMMMRLGLTQVPWYEILVSLAMLVIATALCLWAGAKVFRLGLLMYGKRPSPWEIWRALRQA